MICAFCLAVASCQTTETYGIDACDVLVDIKTKPTTNSYLILNDRRAAESIAKNQLAYAEYQCGLPFVEDEILNDR